MPISESQKQSMRRYNMKTVPMLFRWRMGKDDDVIARLKAVPNRVDYIRNLVRKDIGGTE